MSQADEALTAKLNAAGFGAYQRRLLPIAFLGFSIPNWWIAQSAYFRDQITSEFDISQTVFPVAPLYVFMSWALAAPFTMQLCDMFGRKFVLVWSLSIGALATVLCAVAPSFRIYCAVQPLIGIASCGACACTFLLLTEFVSTKYRAFMLILFHVFGGMSWSVLAGSAYLLQDYHWRSQIVFVQTCPTLLTVLYVKVIAFESPRWLALTRGSESAHIVVDAALAGKLGWRRSLGGSQPSPSNTSIAREWPWTKFHLLCGHSLRVPFVVTIMAWIASIDVYFGEERLIDSFGGDMYLNGFIFGLMEIPPQLVLSFLIENPRVGRRFSFAGSLGLQGLGLLGFVVARDSTVVRLCFVYFAKAANSVTFTVAYIYAAELFPTEVRGTALIGLNFCARASAGLTSLMESWPVHLAILVYSTISLIAAGATLSLRETLGQDLDDYVAGKEPLRDSGVELKQVGA